MAEPLSPVVEQALSAFVAAAQRAFADDLRSVVLFGSGAEGRLRATSDVNVIVVLAAFDPERARLMSEPLSVAAAAIRLRPMFVLDSELPAAADAFAVKFADVLRRRRVLHGPDPFADLAVSRAAVAVRLRQVLLNAILRMRELYVERGLHEEQLARVVAEIAAPLRVSAAVLLELEGTRTDGPCEALERIIADLGEPGWDQVVTLVSEARLHARLPSGAAGPVLLRLIELAQRMAARLAAHST